MKNTFLLLIVITVLLWFISCASGHSESAAPGTEPGVTAGETFSPAESSETVPEETEPAETEPPVPGEVETLSVTWHRGYVASDTNYSATKTLMDGAGNFSYTDVFNIPRAGTRIEFTDTQASGSGGAMFSTNNAYIFSFWKKDSSGNWTLDGSERHYSGVSSLETVISYSKTADEVTYYYVTSKDDMNVRLCYNSGEHSSDKNMPYPKVTAQFTGEKSTDERYDAELAELGKWIESTKETAWYPVLEGKTVNIIGDSYFAGNGLDKHYLWPSLLAAKYGMDLTNRGINGATVCVTDDNKNPIVKRYDKLPDNDPDIVIVEGGRNDYSQFKAGKGGEIGEVGTTDETTYSGALTLIIRGLKAKYPNAMIMCVTPWLASDDIVKYCAAMRKVCVQEGVPCFNALDTKKTNVNMASADFRAKYCMKPSDTSHLNAEGMKRVMPSFEKFIAQEYAVFLKK